MDTSSTMKNALQRRRGHAADGSLDKDAAAPNGLDAQVVHQHEDASVLSDAVLVGKTAVVVGGGPAGMLAAIQLARHGASVQVFESRAFNYDEGSNKWFIVLSERGLAGLKAAGIDVNDSPPSLRFGGLHIIGADGKCGRFRPNRPHLEIQCTRGMLTRYIQEEALRLCPGIVMRYECKLRGGDLAAKRLEFEDVASGQTFWAQADLLIGADGAHSKVQQLMCEQIPGFSIDEQPSFGSLCTFALPKLPDVGEVGSHGNPFQVFPDGDDRAKWLGDGKGNVLTFVTPKQGLKSRFGMVMCIFGSGETTCSFSMPNDAWQRKYTEADVRREILPDFPQLPESICAELIKMLCGTPRPRPVPASMKCSAVSAPGVLLVGDAAHTVTPSLGLGANMAMEDSCSLRAAIQQSGGDILKLCRSYNDLRLDDSRALVDLDRAWCSMRGAAPGPWIKKLLAAAPFLATSSLCKWTVGLPGYFRVQDPIQQARMGLLRMCQVRSRLLRNAAMASFLALGLVAMMSSALLAALRLAHV